MTFLEKQVWAAVYGQTWNLHRMNSPPWKKMPEVTNPAAFYEMGVNDAILQADQAVMDLRFAVEQNERLHPCEDLELERQGEEL